MNVYESDFPCYSLKRTLGVEFHIFPRGADRGRGKLDHRTGHSHDPDAYCPGARHYAVFCANDTLAVGVVKGLAGLRLVPEEMSIVGFDDITIAAYNTPPLTTIKSPILELGRSACAQLLSRIGGSDTPVTSVLLSPDLVVRESAKAPRDKGNC